MKAKQKESHVVSEKIIAAKNDSRNFDVNKIRIIVSDRKRNKEEAVMHCKSLESYKTYDLRRFQESSVTQLPQDKYMIGELRASKEKDINKLMGALVLPLKHHKSI